MNINFNDIIKFILPYLITVLVAFTLMSALYIILPKSAPIVLVDQQNNLKYNRYMVEKSFKEKVKKKVVSRKTKSKPKAYHLIDKIILKAIFSMPNNKGFITIVEKSTSKSYTLSVGDMFKKYQLKEIYAQYVIFVKNGNRYKLSMDDKDDKSKYIIKKVKNKKVIQEDIEKIDDTYMLNRKLVEKYADNFDNIWKEIAIKEIKKDGLINGFKIGNLSTKSVFKKLGLQIGDIIKSVNNITLNSYEQAFKIYKDIDSIENLHIVLVRDNKQMELDYEIK